MARKPSVKINGGMPKGLKTAMKKPYALPGMLGMTKGKRMPKK